MCLLVVSKYTNQKLIWLQRELNEPIVIVGNLTCPSEMYLSSRQKINEDIVELSGAINQLDMIDSYRLDHPESTQHTFLSGSQGAFSKTNHILGYKAHLTNL